MFLAGATYNKSTDCFVLTHSRNPHHTAVWHIFRVDNMSVSDKNTELQQLEEKQLDSKLIYSGSLLKVYRDEIELPNGKHTGREYIKHNGAVCIAALKDDGTLAVEHQYRYPFHRIVTELPAGKLDTPDEDPLEAAKRELREETGIRADKWIYLGGFIPTCAYSTELIHMYLASGLHFGDKDLDEDEFINVRFVPLDELVDKVMSGEIQDSKTQTVVLKAAYLRDHGKLDA